MCIGRIVLALALFSSLASTVAYGACNMGEDAKNITELNFGRLKLFGFPAGALSVSGQHALPDADSWPFSLKSPNRQMSIAVVVPGTATSVPFSFTGIHLQE
jgi:hypothetical protein